MIAALEPLLAHQSDWLSMVMVCIPLATFAAILVVANRRATRHGPVEVLPVDVDDNRSLDQS